MAAGMEPDVADEKGVDVPLLLMIFGGFLVLFLVSFARGRRPLGSPLQALLRKNSSVDEERRKPCRNQRGSFPNG